MPYIKRVRRELVDAQGAANPGDLNYLITRLCIDHWNFHVKNYTTINDIMGALECAKQEFYRRVAVPYEEKKKEENGDVY